MPVSYNVRQRYPWYLTGIPAMEGYLGKTDIQKIGSRWSPGDSNFWVARRYDAFIFRGQVVSPAVGLGSGAEVLNPRDGMWGPFSTNDFPVGSDRVLNKAYSRAVEVLHGVSTQLGATLAESGEIPGQLKGVASAVKTAARRVERATMTMVRAYRRLRKGDVLGCAERLGVRPLRRHRRAYDSARRRKRTSQLTRRWANEASSLWLQYWFGWAPLASEVYDGVGILCTDRFDDQWFTIKGTASFRGSFRGSNGSVTKDYHREGRGPYVIRGKVQAEARVSNPNFARNTSLGLNNPVSVAWELVPFSFVVDWFTNVGQVVNSYTDLWGFETRDPFYTVYLKGQLDAWMGPVPSVGGRRACHVRWDVWRVWRRLGWYKPTLVRPALMQFGHSVTRAATAVSLLIALFIGH